MLIMMIKIKAGGHPDHCHFDYHDNLDHPDYPIDGQDHHDKDDPIYIMMIPYNFYDNDDGYDHDESRPDGYPEFYHYVPAKISNGSFSSSKCDNIYTNPPLKRKPTICCQNLVSFILKTGF